MKTVRGPSPLRELDEGQSFQTIHTRRIGYIVSKDLRHATVHVCMGDEELNLHPNVVVLATE